MTFYIVRRHPRHPFYSGHLEAFTIESIWTHREPAVMRAEAKNKRSSYLHTVKRITVDTGEA